MSIGYDYHVSLISRIDYSHPVSDLKIRSYSRYALQIRTSLSDTTQLTIRENLDPEAHYTDAQIWSALDKASARSIVENLPGKLDHDVKCDVSPL